MINDNDLQRLAAAIHALRPDWPAASLHTYLHAKHAGRSYRDLAVALAWVAADSASKTPARLDENGPWWVAATAAAGTPQPDRFTACPHCGNYHTFAEEPCFRRADTQHAAAAAQAARQGVASVGAAGAQPT